MLYEAEGTGRPPLLGADDVEFEFWRAMLASASRMEEPLAPAAGAGGFACRFARGLAGGLPGGVVEVSARLCAVRFNKSTLLN